MSVIKIILNLFLLGVIAAGFYIWSGVFNIAANEKHWEITTELLEIVRDRSVSVRAESITVPADLTDVSRVKRGAANYAAMCEQCHLAPGVESSELYEGLYPQPPLLYKDEDLAGESKEVFWIIKNGIKMTGMPAWGINNSDEQIWDMIALISALDKLGADEYKKLVDSGKHAHKGDAHAETGMPTAGDHDEGASTEIPDSHGAEENTDKNNSNDHNDDGHGH